MEVTKKIISRLRAVAYEELRKITQKMSGIRFSREV